MTQTTGPPTRDRAITTGKGARQALLITAGCAVIALTAGAIRPVAGTPGVGDPYFPRAGNSGMHVTDYDIHIRYDPPTDHIDGHTAITARATESLTSFDLDLRLPASAVTINDHPARFQQDTSKLHITPASLILIGSPVTIEVDYAGVPSAIPAGPDTASPWIRTADGAVAVGEPDIAPWWYPCNDHPSDKASYTITAAVPAGLQAISNGAPLTSPQPAGPGLEQWQWRETEPMATYLAFIAIGHYDIVRRDTRYGPYLAAYAHNVDQQFPAARASIEQTPHIIDYLSGILGPYPFHQLGGVVPDTQHLFFSLETQTRPVYSEAYFATNTDTTVVVHELAHQWFGDSVSLDHWSDIWLNEGFATYTEWLYDQDHGGISTAQRADLVYTNHPADDTYWRIPPGDPGAAAILDPAVYSRGAMALQALRTAVGDHNFFATLRTWVSEYAHRNGSVHDFLGLLSQVSGQNITQVAHDWLYTPNQPQHPPSAPIPAPASTH